MRPFMTFYDLSFWNRASLSQDHNPLRPYMENAINVIVNMVKKKSELNLLEKKKKIRPSKIFLLKSRQNES